MSWSKEKLDELCDVPVPLRLSFKDSMIVTEKLQACGCEGCMELADRIHCARSESLLGATLSPDLLAVVDQRIAEDRKVIRTCYLTKCYLRLMQPCFMSSLDVLSVLPRLTQAMTALDMTLPIAELVRSIEELATSHRATWGQGASRADEAGK